MIEIISGTDRPGSKSLMVAKLLLADYQALNVPAALIDLSHLNLNDVNGSSYFKPAPGSFGPLVERVTKADGVVLVVPEYNGSYPGILKLFIDYWNYPKTFEHRAFAFVGIGTRWGGLRPIEHLQQVMSYRNGYNFPNRVFVTNVKEAVKDGQIHDPMIIDLLKIQTREFVKFVAALKSQGLDANSRLTP